MPPQHLGPRCVGPEGVKPSPRGVKARHASLHFDPVLLSFCFLFSFALHGQLHGHTSTLRLTMSGHTNPVERTRALHTPLVGPFGVEPTSHAARRLQRRSLPGDEPRALKRRKPPRFTGRLYRGKTLENTPFTSLAPDCRMQGNRRRRSPRLRLREASAEWNAYTFASEPFVSVLPRARSVKEQSTPSVRFRRTTV